MKHALLCLLLVTAATAAQPPAADKFDRLPARINDMIGRRLNHQPLAAVLPNPFLLPGAVPVTPAANSGTDRPSEPATDLAALNRYAATLKVSGTMDIGGKPHLIINSSAYGEGDLIKVRDTNPVDFVRVLQITPRTLTLGYGSARLEVPLRLN
ncbi:MAG: hypothetical protein C0502_05450 [Opitutus sp.]|nr:hypothetical protein [Opitutus sp.]